MSGENLPEILPRYIEDEIIKDLDRKMVFLAGPRQVGKTTFATHLLEKKKARVEDRYMYWDSPEDRENIIRERFPTGEGLLVLDEVHKYSRWRQVVKDPGARFENLVACHILKWCRYLEDTQGRDMELRYFRDIDRREVDFVVTEENKPV